MAAGSIPFLLTPMGLLLVGLAVAAVVVVTHWSQLQRGLARTWMWMKTAAGDVVRWFKSNWMTIAAVITGPIGLAARLIYKHFGAIVHFVGGIPAAIGKAAKGMFDAIPKALASAIRWVTSLWGSLPAVVRAMIGFSVGGVTGGPIGAIAGATGGAFGFGNVANFAKGIGHDIGIPGLAAGGRVRRAGHALVGEQGPEVLSLPQGAQVTPLTPGSMGGPTPVFICHIDGREVFRAMARQSLMNSAAGT
jgi:hypothetical protein